MRKQNTEILGDVIRQVLRENHLDGRLYEVQYEVQLIRSWETVLGTYINSYTENLYIKNKILYAKISSAALRHELFLSKSILIGNLNKAVGVQVINDIHFL